MLTFGCGHQVLPPPADAEGGFVLVRVAVSGGDGDLPSAAHLLLRQVHQGQLQVSFHNQPLTPDPQSLEIQHEFVQPPVLPDEHGPEPTPEIIGKHLSLSSFIPHMGFYSPPLL